MSEKLPLSGVKVVLIDDSNTIRRSGEIFLSQAGCKVVLAEDGFDGLYKVVETQPDIIFVDVMMPRLDGYQTCALIKNHHDFRNIPVVILTSKDTLFDRARGRDRFRANRDHLPYRVNRVRRFYGQRPSH